MRVKKRVKRQGRGVLSWTRSLWSRAGQSRCLVIILALCQREQTLDAPKLDFECSKRVSLLQYP